MAKKEIIEESEVPVKKVSFFKSIFTKSQKPPEEFDPFSTFIDETDDDAFETKSEELHKYSLVFKVKNLFKNNSESSNKSGLDDDDEGGDSSEFQQSLMGDSNSGDVAEDDSEVGKKLLYRLRWYEWLFIIGEVLLILYVILVFFRIVSIF